MAGARGRWALQTRAGALVRHWQRRGSVGAAEAQGGRLGAADRLCVLAHAALPVGPPSTSPVRLAGHLAGHLTTGPRSSPRVCSARSCTLHS